MNLDKTNEVIEILNKIMEYELSGVVRYTHYALMITGRDRLSLAQFFKDQASESLLHAQEAGEIVTGLGGHPSLKIQLIEEPKWEITPNHSKYGANGELPIIEELKLNNGEVMKLSKFKSTKEQDLRWYDWRLQKWDTKWDVPKDDIEITEVNYGHLIIGFNTAWSPPIAIYKKLRNIFKDVKITWWALDEDDDKNGEGYYLI